MVKQRRPNPVRGRVIVEVTPQHAVIYLCDRMGYVTDQEIFRYPQVMSSDECILECRDLFSVMYDAIDSVVNPELQEGPPERQDSE